MWIAFALALTVTTKPEEYEAHLVALNASLGGAAEEFSVADQADFGSYSGEEARRAGHRTALLLLIFSGGGARGLPAPVDAEV